WAASSSRLHARSRSRRPSCCRTSWTSSAASRCTKRPCARQPAPSRTRVRPSGSDPFRGPAVQSAAVTEFQDRVKPLLADVPGWLTDEEGEALYELGKRCTGRGAIVESGSWKGKSR